MTLPLGCFIPVILGAMGSVINRGRVFVIWVRHCFSRSAYFSFPFLLFFCVPWQLLSTWRQSHRFPPAIINSEKWVPSLRSPVGSKYHIGNSRPNFRTNVPEFLQLQDLLLDMASHTNHPTVKPDDDINNYINLVGADELLDLLVKWILRRFRKYGWTPHQHFLYTTWQPSCKFLARI